MNINKERMKELLEKYANKSATQDEVNELFSLIQGYDDEAISGLVAEMMEENKPEYDSERTERLLRGVLGSISTEEKAKAPVKKLYPGTGLFKKSWMRVAVAAAIIGLIVLGFVVYNNQQSTLVSDQPGSLAVKEDIAAPDKSRASITLSDGSTVYLDEVKDGMVAEQMGVEVVKLGDGQISYTLRQAQGDKQQLIYNTLTNPRGSKVIDITLSDGSRVWLNAGSSVTYPVAFMGNERKVSINGEAYFEIQKVEDSRLRETTAAEGREKIEGVRKNIPFLVESNGVVTEVLGTHFNVNSYGDDGMIKVTLLEGSVRVKPPAPKGEDDKTAKGIILKPGQQAKVVSSELSVVSGVDTEEVMAWKNGRFLFGDKSDLKSIMRELARWYDVNVEYAGNVEVHFGGSISRSASLSEVLKALEATGNVKFKIEGKKVVVRP